MIILNPKQRKIISGYHDSLKFIQRELENVNLSIQKNEYEEDLKRNVFTIGWLEKKYNFELKNLLNYMIGQKIPLTRDFKTLKKMIEE